MNGDICFLRTMAIGTRENSRNNKGTPAQTIYVIQTDRILYKCGLWLVSNERTTDSCWMNVLEQK